MVLETDRNTELSDNFISIHAIHKHTHVHTLSLFLSLTHPHKRTHTHTHTHTSGSDLFLVNDLGDRNTKLPNEVVSVRVRVPAQPNMSNQTPMYV